MEHRTLCSTSKDLSLDHETATMWVLPITLVLLTAVLLPHAILYRENAFEALWRETGVVLGVAGFLASIVIHELLHSITAIVLGRLRWQDVTYGVNWKMLTPYAHPGVPLTARVYAFTAAAPGIILGLVPALVGLAAGWGAWSGYGALMLAAAGGDILILWTLRDVPDAALVQDHPSRVGCYLVADEGGDGAEDSAGIDATATGTTKSMLARSIGYALIIVTMCGSAAGVAVLLT